MYVRLSQGMAVYILFIVLMPKRVKEGIELDLKTTSPRNRPNMHTHASTQRIQNAVNSHQTRREINKQALNQNIPPAINHRPKIPTRDRHGGFQEVFLQVKKHIAAALETNIRARRALQGCNDFEGGKYMCWHCFK